MLCQEDMLYYIGYYKACLLYTSTEYTRAGKYLYAVGANPIACDYIGIDGKIQKIKGFVITALCCALAGIMQGSQMNAASPTLGENMFVPALTTVFLGATYGKIGVFNVPGTLVGAVLYALINQGLLMITSDLWLKNYVQGGMLLFALVMVVVIRARERKMCIRDRLYIHPLWRWRSLHRRDLILLLECH